MNAHFSGIKSREVPKFEKNTPFIKLNSAAIKREAVILQKIEENENSKLKNLEID